MGFFVPFCLTLFFIPVVCCLFKNKSQPIRQDGPSSHIISKKGILPLGGIAILLSVLVSFFIICREIINIYHVLIISTAFAMFAIGLVDDLLKIFKKNTKGISGLMRLFLEFNIYAVFVLFLVMIDGSTSTSIPIPFVGIVDFDFGVFYVPFAIFCLVATANAVNLTDGLDGLAGTQVIVSLIFCIGVAMFLNNDPLKADIIPLIIVLVFAILGFLVKNFYPASIFMGDNGSLMLGSIVGTLFVIFKIEFALLFVGFVYFIESVSVILQVYSFKIFKKRIFKMAPIHHHFELIGYKETKIVFAFLVTAIMLSIYCFTLFL